MSKTRLLTWCISTYAQNDKSVKILTQLVVEVANNGIKTPMSHEVVSFQMLDFGTSKSNSGVSKSNSNILVENYFLSRKLRNFQREPFLTMFYTINSSPLVVTN